MSHAHCNSIAPPETTGERPFKGSINEEHEVPCRSTISNVIKRHNFFFRADTKPFKRRSKSGARAFERRRVKGNLKAAEPNRVIEFDMKHIRIPNNGKKYAMVAIDVVAKQAVIHVSNTCTSASGKIAYQKAVARFGRDAVYVNDNGGENQGSAMTAPVCLAVSCSWCRSRALFCARKSSGYMFTAEI